MLPRRYRTVGPQRQLSPRLRVSMRQWYVLCLLPWITVRPVEFQGFAAPQQQYGGPAAPSVTGAPSQFAQKVSALPTSMDCG